MIKLILRDLKTRKGSGEWSMKIVVKAAVGIALVAGIMMAALSMMGTGDPGFASYVSDLIGQRSDTSRVQ